MKYLVDTCIWSSVLRGSKGSQLHESRMKELISVSAIVMIGPIRQEILSGIRTKEQFEILKKRLSFIKDENLISQDYVEAAKIFNVCRSKGVQGSNTDFLICSLSLRLKCGIYSTDKDFLGFKKIIPGLEIFSSD